MASEGQEAWPSPEGIKDLLLSEYAFRAAGLRDIEESWGQDKAELTGSDLLEHFTEKLYREWAIETGQIENLYDIDRGVTETLIEQGLRSAYIPKGSVSKPSEEVLALIEDQRAALDGLFAFVKQDRQLGTSYIRELHREMTQSQTTVRAFTPDGSEIEVEMKHGEYKVHPNSPKRDGVHYLYCPPERTDDQMEALISFHEKHLKSNVSPEVEAAWLHHRFTQIHPFQDGNGRVARALASLVLVRAGLFPLIVSRDEKDNYLSLLEIADAGDIIPFVRFIARLQQTRYRIARRIFVRERRQSNTVREAVENLTAAANLTTVNEHRQQVQTLETVGQKVGAGLSHAGANAQPGLGQGLGGFGGGRPGTAHFSVEEDVLRQLATKTVENQLSVEVAAPVYAHLVDLNIANMPIKVVVCYGPVRLDIRGRIWLIGVIQSKNEWFALQGSAQLWTADEANAIDQNAVNNFCDEIVIEGLDRLRDMLLANPLEGLS